MGTQMISWLDHSVRQIHVAALAPDLTGEWRFYNWAGICGFLSQKCSIYEEKRLQLQAHLSLKDIVQHFGETCIRFSAENEIRGLIQLSQLHVKYNDAASNHVAYHWEYKQQETANPALSKAHKILCCLFSQITVQHIRMCKHNVNKTAKNWLPVGCIESADSVNPFLMCLWLQLLISSLFKHKITKTKRK